MATIWHLSKPLTITMIFQILIGAESTGGYVTTIDDQDMVVFDIRTYPNPAANALYVEAPLVSTFEMAV